MYCSGNSSLFWLPFVGLDVWVCTCFWTVLAVDLLIFSVRVIETKFFLTCGGLKEKPAVKSTFPSKTSWCTLSTHHLHDKAPFLQNDVTWITNWRGSGSVWMLTVPVTPVFIAGLCSESLCSQVPTSLGRLFVQMRLLNCKNFWKKNKLEIKIRLEARLKAVWSHSAVFSTQRPPQIDTAQTWEHRGAVPQWKLCDCGVNTILLQGSWS